MKSMCVYSNIMINKNKIFNSRLLDPNEEYQAMIPIVGHLEGVNRWRANQMHNNTELKTNYAN